MKLLKACLGIGGIAIFLVIMANVRSSMRSEPSTTNIFVSRSHQNVPRVVDSESQKSVAQLDDTLKSSDAAKIAGGNIKDKVSDGDPFPKLKTFEKIVNNSFSGENPDVLRRQLQLLINDPPAKYRYKLIELPKELPYWFGYKLTDVMMNELSNHPDGKFIFQDQHIYKNLEDSALDPDLPLCIVQTSQAHDLGGDKIESFGLYVGRNSFPIKSERNFRGVRIENLPYMQNMAINIAYIDCGFISDSEPQEDRYKLLEYMHLFSTISFGIYDRNSGP